MVPNINTNTKLITTESAEISQHNGGEREYLKYADSMSLNFSTELTILINSTLPCLIALAGR